MINRTERTDSFNKVLKYLQLYKIVIIQGLRRIGKSLVMTTIAKESKYDEFSKLFLDAKMFGQDNKVEMNKILHIVKEQLNINHLVIVDEFQELEDWNNFFYTLHKFDNVRVIATGSVSANRELVKNTEGGRFGHVQMEPLSFNEYQVIFKPIFLSDKEIFNNFATFGSYPDQEFTNDLTIYKKQISDNIIENINNTKLLKVAQISNPEHVNNILMHLIENIGQLQNSNSIARKLNIDARTIEKIISYLKQTFIIRDIINSKQGKGKAAQNNKKYYLTDHTFYLFVKQVNFQDLKDFDLEYQSMLFENIIINEVIKKFGCHNLEVGFERFKNNSQGKSTWIDLDMVIIKDGQKIPFEIKNSEANSSLSPSQKKIKNLNIIYKGVTKKQGERQYINYIDFIKEVEKWI